MVIILFQNCHDIDIVLSIPMIKTFHVDSSWGQEFSMVLDSTIIESILKPYAASTKTSRLEFGWIFRLSIKLPKFYSHQSLFDYYLHHSSRVARAWLFVIDTLWMLITTFKHLKCKQVGTSVHSKIWQIFMHYICLTSLHYICKTSTTGKIFF